MRLRICEGLLNLAFRLDVSRCDCFDTSSRCDNLEPPGTALGYPQKQYEDGGPPLFLFRSEDIRAGTKPPVFTVAKSAVCVCRKKDIRTILIKEPEGPIRCDVKTSWYVFVLSSSVSPCLDSCGH